ncbi:MAG: EAL domain-containing protein [Anoxybacillus sp.]|nr:EAL domain-containing protein [Anoxybacillus sp.]MCL6587829.1 EAL domain-containing protein [Anoxybacillus sp.]
MQIDIITKIIHEELYTNVYQPIYRLIDKSIAGYESLFRCTFVNSPDLLFNFANTNGSLYILDIASIKNSIKTFSLYRKHESVNNVFLSLNVYPSTVANRAFPKILEQLIGEFSLSNQQVVLEINESERIENLDKMLQNISLLKQKGFIIALDDVGKGEYSLQALIEIDPQVIKLDRYFAKDLAQNKEKQRAISSFIKFFREGTSFILEGIETKEDLYCAELLGIHYGQGYYLGKPQALYEITED